VRCFLSYVSGERNRGTLSVDPVPNPSSAFLRARAQQILRPSLSLADLEQAVPSSISDDALDGRMSELSVLAPWRPAAILLPIIDRPGGLTVLLTLRASDLRAHSGQVAFPGGKVDAGETPHLAALREAQEEIGLEARVVEPLGWLDPFFTGTGFRVAPLVALIEPSFALTVNKLEVDEVFETPFAFLMDAANHHLEEREWAGQWRRYYAMPHEGRYIWGATAGILRNLYEKLFP
jgi:8-oxo-dGTP pyrophosphatase MutT (NUDIX family)